MGGCLSKKKSTQNNLVQSTPTNRESIITNKPRGNCEITKTRPSSNAKENTSVDEADSVPTTAIELGGLKIRYASMTKRGYYPEGE